MPVIRPDLRHERLRTLHTHGLDAAALLAPLAPFAHIGLAVSGGPDSLALMLLATGWAVDRGKQLTVYTVDHGLRPEAPAECDMVAETAAALGLACRKLAWTGPKPETGVQAAARLARYRLIGAAMQADGAEILVTAHHVDDQAETVMMRLAHGSGLSGLSGMALFGEVDGVRLCRPLLGVERTHLRDLVREAGLTAAADPSNTDEHYERVRWRYILPGLAKDGLDAERLAGFAARMARADAALTQATDAAVAELARIDRFGVIRIPFTLWADLPEEIGLRLLDRAVRFAGGDAARYRLSLIEAAGTALRGAAPGHAATLGGAAVVRTDGQVLVFREFGRMPPADAVLPESGASMIFDGRFKISCAEGRVEDLVLSAAGDGLTRAEAEALCGPIGVPMRAIAAAPALRTADGRLVALGTGSGGGVEIECLFATNPGGKRQ